MDRSLIYTALFSALYECEGYLIPMATRIWIVWPWKCLIVLPAHFKFQSISLLQLGFGLQCWVLEGQKLSCSHSLCGSVHCSRQNVIATDVGLELSRQKGIFCSFVYLDWFIFLWLSISVLKSVLFSACFSSSVSWSMLLKLDGLSW